MRNKICYSIVLIFISLTLSFADKVIMNDGRIIDCIIKREESDKIVIDSFGVEISIPRSNIKKIEKLDLEESIITEGDKLLEQKKYDKAIKAYQGAMSVDAEKAKAKIEIIKQIWIKDVEEQLIDIPIDEAEKILREQLKNTTQSGESFSPFKIVLIHILFKRAEEAKDKVDYEESMKYLDEAWNLVVDVPDYTLDFIRELQKYKNTNERIISMLRSYIKKNPENIEAIDILIDYIWEKNPWEALSYVYPNNALNPRATKKTTSILPQLLLACFNSKPYPENAPINRVSCYERYLEFNPNANRTPLLKARVEQDSENLQYLYDYAVYLEEQKKLENSITLFQKIKSEDPDFKDVTKKVEDLYNAICENKIIDEDVEVRKLEISFRKLGDLLPPDFPPTSNTTDLVQSAKYLSTLLQKRPTRNNNEPPEYYLHALQGYHQLLMEKIQTANQISSVSDTYKQQIEAERQKQLLAKRDDYIRRYIIRKEGFKGTISGYRTSEWTHYTGKGEQICNFTEIRVGEMKVYSGAKLIFHAQNIIIQNDEIISAIILYIE